MADYNYYKAMQNDIEDYFNEHAEELNAQEFYSVDDAYDYLYDDLFVSDSITGNASGSYTFSTYEAEENIALNLDLLAEALEEFCCNESSYISKGAEACDVTIRCYLLSQVLSEALNNLEEDEEGRLIFD